MSWLTRVRQSIPFLPKRETPENLWHKCRGCGQMVFVKEFEDNLHVCPKCEFHERIGAKVRFRQILDLGTCALIPTQRSAEDPLKFRELCQGARIIPEPFPGESELQTRTRARASEDAYTGQSVGVVITYVIAPGTWGLPEDLIVFGIKPLTV